MGVEVKLKRKYVQYCNTTTIVLIVVLTVLVQYKLTTVYY